jgi:hypothetical protein
MVFATFNNVSVFYHKCAVVRVFRRLMCYATFNIQSRLNIVTDIKDEPPDPPSYSRGVVED